MFETLFDLADGPPLAMGGIQSGQGHSRVSGPYGACQADGSEYSGLYVHKITREELKSWHRPRIEALVSANIDLLALETLPALSEALALVEVMREFPADAKHTSHGDLFSEAVKQCCDKAGGGRGGGQLIGVGVNCTPPQHIAPLLLAAHSTLPPPHVLPRVVYPNKGEKWMPGIGWQEMEAGGSWPYLGDVGTWGSLGARLLGGCCRLGPGDIKKLAGC
ncbi:Homocysteine S-methyltransferase YbgG [Chionoecetes opilio]|uniref:Homocysteine S-methyltransferase YbgG n=1 Tax=Chionoecetes opilio TaxID=41210 RepID=A0A8J4Y6Y6_CHIOP|nr:Homocysteine S-methyltransferase YbgG [Chionoecetes opilio]